MKQMHNEYFQCITAITRSGLDELKQDAISKNAFRHEISKRFLDKDEWFYSLDCKKYFVSPFLTKLNM